MTDPLPHPSFPPLEVSSNPAGTDRLTRPSLIVGIVGTALIAVGAPLLAALLASASGFAIGAMASLIFLVPFILLLGLTINTAHSRGVQSIRRTVLMLDASGFRASIPQGELRLPWDAIQRLSTKSRFGRHIITFHLSSAVTNTSTGVDTTLHPSVLAALVRRGFSIAQPAVDTPLETLVAASSAFTGGRLDASVATARWR